MKINYLSIKSFLKRHKVFFISILVFTFVFFVFYPTKTVTIDEHDYLFNSQLLLKGNLKTDCTTSIPGQWDVGDYCISKYNIGTSFFLLPAVVLNINPIVITLIVFILSAVIFYKLLIRFNLNKNLIFLFVLFPPFIYFSRTLLSETYSMFLILLFFYILRLKNPKSLKLLFAGLIFILSVYVKYTNVLAVTLIFLYFAFKKFRETTFIEAVKFYLPFLISTFFGVVSLFLFNLHHYGGILRSGYYFSSEEGNFVLSQSIFIFIKYVILINLIYPLLFLAIYKSKIKLKKLYIALLALFLIFYSLVKNESFPGKVTDLILGFRFLIPVFPFLLLMYIDFVSELKLNRKILAILLILLIIATFGVSYLHYNFLKI